MDAQAVDLGLCSECKASANDSSRYAADMQQICLNHGLNSEAASFMAFVKDLVMRTLVKLAEMLSLTPRYA